MRTKNIQRRGQKKKVFGIGANFSREYISSTLSELDYLSGLIPPMKLSRKSDYGLRALFTLVDEYGNGPVSVRELAERNDVSQRFLEQIMLELRRHGVVESIPGRVGGFVLAKRPEQITMGEVVRLFDSVLAPIGCVSVTQYEPCSQEPTCRFRRVLLNLRNYNAQVMDKADLASVAAGRPVRRDEVFTPEFIGGGGI